MQVLTLQEILLSLMISMEHIQVEDPFKEDYQVIIVVGLYLEKHLGHKDLLIGEE